MDVDAMTVWVRATRLFHRHACLHLLTMFLTRNAFSVVLKQPPVERVFFLALSAMSLNVISVQLRECEYCFSIYDVHRQLHIYGSFAILGNFLQ